MTTPGNEQPDDRLLEVGRIGRPHGLKGEVTVDFVTNRLDERTAPGAELWAGGRRLEVRAARPHQKRWLISFAGVDDRNAAERLRGLLLEAIALDDPDALFVHELIGKLLVDQHGTGHGPVVAVVENPASDLLELEDGRLVPLAFLIDQDPESVRVSVPAGLLDDPEAEADEAAT
ncbi:MAG: ribosome maturation factor RimM [Acidimicrobiia bacterium]|nr:ribosome maturation factor RimM [Acidimicrobiia bacterium]